MSQKTGENGTKAPVSKEEAKQFSITVLGEKQNLEGRQEGLKKRAITGAATLKSTAPRATPNLPPTPVATPRKHLTSVAALGQSSSPPKRESKPSQAQAPHFQRTPATAIIPKASAALAPSPSKSPAQFASAENAGKAAAAAPPSRRTAPKTVNVRFAFSRTDSKRVSLCGEFNGWSLDATPMKQIDGHCWEATLALPPGRYQYKFVVDGQWLHDPNARENLPNPYGSFNSVMEVRI